MGHRDAVLTSQAALLLAAITIAAIDSDVDDDEIATIRRLDRSRSTTAWEVVLKTTRLEQTNHDCATLVSAALNSDQRLMTIGNFIDIAMAMEACWAAKALLEQHATALGTSQQQVAGIVDVISIETIT